MSDTDTKDPRLAPIGYVAAGLAVTASVAGAVAASVPIMIVAATFASVSALSRFSFGKGKTPSAPAHDKPVVLAGPQE